MSTATMSTVALNSGKSHPSRHRNRVNLSKFTKMAQLTRGSTGVIQSTAAGYTLEVWIGQDRQWDRMSWEFASWTFGNDNSVRYEWRSMRHVTSR